MSTTPKTQEDQIDVPRFRVDTQFGPLEVWLFGATSVRIWNSYLQEEAFTVNRVDVEVDVNLKLADGEWTVPDATQARFGSKRGSFTERASSKTSAKALEEIRRAWADWVAEYGDWLDSAEAIRLHNEILVSKAGLRRAELELKKERRHIDDMQDELQFLLDGGATLNVEGTLTEDEVPESNGQIPGHDVAQHVESEDDEVNEGSREETEDEEKEETEEEGSEDEETEDEEETEEETEEEEEEAPPPPPKKKDGKRSPKLELMLKMKKQIEEEKAAALKGGAKVKPKKPAPVPYSDPEEESEEESEEEEEDLEDQFGG